MEMIKAQPIIKVHSNIACCDGGTISSVLQHSPIALSHYYYCSDTLPLPLLLGGGALGHPKVFINLVGQQEAYQVFHLYFKDRNEPNECGYCGLRFQHEHAHH